MEEVSPRPTIDELVERHAATLYRIAVRFVGSAADAEDLVQDTFLEAHRHLGQLRDPQAALAWLIRILRSHRAKWVQERRRRPTVTLEEILEPACVDLDPLVEPDAKQVLSVLDRLPDEYREPLVLFYFEEMRYREIAEALDLPIGTVMSRLARAKMYLRANVRLDGAEMQLP